MLDTKIKKSINWYTHDNSVTVLNDHYKIKKVVKSKEKTTNIILNIILKNKGLTILQIMDKAKMPRVGVVSHLKRLVHQGTIKQMTISSNSNINQYKQKTVGIYFMSFDL